VPSLRASPPGAFSRRHGRPDMPRVVGVDHAGADPPRDDPHEIDNELSDQHDAATLGDIEEICDGETIWRFDRDFLLSRWTCLWGRGCEGIEPEPAAHLGLGCCSVGAHLGDVDEARLISALAATLAPEIFEHHAQAVSGGVFGDALRLHTRVVEGACIFLNRPGFAGGAGCALHLAAVEAGESPVEWKPSVCWQLPIRVDWEPGATDPDDPDGAPGPEVATVRRWTRKDWGVVGETMAWCCTEGPKAYVGERPVIESLAAELQGVVGTEVYVELRRRVTGT